MPGRCCSPRPRGIGLDRELSAVLRPWMRPLADEFEFHGQDGGGPVVVLTMSLAATTWSRGSLGSCSSRAMARWTARWVRWRGFWPTVVRLMYEIRAILLLS